VDGAGLAVQTRFLVRIGTARGAKMADIEAGRKSRLWLNRLLILLMVALLLGGLLLSQWQRVLINAILL
jgi:hypothetical protein